MKLIIVKYLDLEYSVCWSFFFWLNTPSQQSSLQQQPLKKGLRNNRNSAGATLLIIGFLIIFAVIDANLSVASIVIPVIIMIVGALLMAYGNRSLYRSKANSTAGLKNVFCRYCGKKTVTGEYCSTCRKSSQSSTVTMKIWSSV